MKKVSCLLILAAGSLWGFLGFYFRHLSALGFSQMQIVFMRVFVACIVLGVILLMKDPSLFRIRLKDIWCFLGTGILSLLLFNLCYFSAMKYITVSMAAVLLYTAPGFVVILSAFLFKEKITGKKVAALAVMFFGCMCVSGIFGGGHSLTSMGLLLGIGAAVAYALYSIFSRFALNRGYESYTITFYTFFFATLGVLPFAQVGNLVQGLTLPGIGYGVALGVLGGCVPFLLFTLGMRALENGEASMLATSEPVVASLLSVMALGEPMTASCFLGIIFIVLGIMVMNCKGFSFAKVLHLKRV